MQWGEAEGHMSCGKQGWQGWAGQEGARCVLARCTILGKPGLGEQAGQPCSCHWLYFMLLHALKNMSNYRVQHLYSSLGPSS